MHRWIAIGGMSAQLAHAAVVPAGVYAVDPARTAVEFRLEIMGLIPVRGAFTGTTGRLVFDPAHPSACALSVDVPVRHLAGSETRMAIQLQSPGWLDAAQYPDMRFASTEVRMLGPGEAEVSGILTMRGIARPLTLHAHLRQATANPAGGGAEISFDAEGHLHRSAFGVDAMPLLVSDDVRLILRASFAPEH